MGIKIDFQLIADSAAKRAADAKSVEDKEAEKAALEARLLKDEEEKTATTKEAMLTHEYLAEVHGDCDWLLLGLPGVAKSLCVPTVPFMLVIDLE